METNKHQADIDIILSHRHDLGADYWTTPDKRLGKGSPFSCIDCSHMLLELGMEATDPILKEVAELFFSVWRKDGRFKLSPSLNNIGLRLITRRLEIKPLLPEGFLRLTNVGVLDTALIQRHRELADD